MTQKTKLTVTQAFGAYAVGDEITDTEVMKSVSRTHPRSVVRSTADAPPALELDPKTGEYVAPKKPTQSATRTTAPTGE